MKKTILLLCATAICGSAFAQKLTKTQKTHLAAIQSSVTNRATVISMDTIFSIGKPYGVIMFVGSKEHYRPEFKVEDLSGHSVAIIKNDDTGFTGRAQIRFVIGTEQVCYPTRETGNPEDMRLKIAEKLVARDVLEAGGVVNIEAINRFVAEFPAPEKTSKVLAGDLKEIGTGLKAMGQELGIANKPATDIVERDRSQTINLGAHDILQGGVVIGKYETSGFNNGGVVTTQVSITYTNGNKCASARFMEGAGNASLFTPKDAKQQEIPVQPTKELEGIVQFLILNAYL